MAVSGNQQEGIHPIGSQGNGPATEPARIIRPSTDGLPGGKERHASSATLLEELATELYFRAASAKSREERAAIKGVQHSIERVLDRFGYLKPTLKAARGQMAEEKAWPWFDKLTAYTESHGGEIRTFAAEKRATVFTNRHKK
jgi:hypothetical protein